MPSDRIIPYLDLIRRFLGSTIDAQTFERSYLEAFKNEDISFPDDAFLILDRLFADVDAFCPDSKLRGKDDLSEEQLREACAEALKRLEELREDEPGNPGW